MGEDGWEKPSLLALFGSPDAAGLRSSPLGTEHGEAVNSGVRGELLGVLAGAGKQGAALLKGSSQKGFLSSLSWFCLRERLPGLEVRDERGLRLGGSKRRDLAAEVPEMLVASSPALSASFPSPT